MLQRQEQLRENALIRLPEIACIGATRRWRFENTGGFLMVQKDIIMLSLSPPPDARLQGHQTLHRSQYSPADTTIPL